MGNNDTETGTTDESPAAQREETMFTVVEPTIEYLITDDPRNIPIDYSEANKTCQIVDLNLFSGSSDVFRTNVGGYFFNTVDLDGNTVLSFESFDTDPDGRLVAIGDSYRSLNSYIASVRSYGLGSSALVSDEEEVKSKIVPNYKFVVAVDGDPDRVLSDKFWQTLWLGGTFNEIEYDALINQGIFDDYYTTYNHPYSAIARQYLTNPSAIGNYMNISYEYNSYFSNYQPYASGIETERYLPNMYLNTWAYLFTTGAGDYMSNVYNFVSCDEKIENPQDLFDDADGIKAYLDVSASTLTMGAATMEWANRKFQNVFFNDGFFKNVYDAVSYIKAEGDDSAGTLSGSYPYYGKIDFHTEPQGFFGGSIVSAGFSSRLLRLLKEVFLNEAPALSVPRGPTQFQKNTRYVTSSVELQANTVVTNNEQIDLLGVDFFDLMLYSYRKISNDADNFIIIDSPSIEVVSTYDTKAVYRHLNTSNTLELMNNVLSELQSEKGITDIHSLLNVKKESTQEDITDIQYPEQKDTEVIAYRIEKLGGTVQEDQTRSSVVQNFWFFNAHNLYELDFVDTQVKYGAKYTYNIYEYRVIQGVKYKYSDLQLSRIIGLPNTELEATTTEEVPEFYCIEYYNPSDETTTNNLLENVEGPSGWTWDSETDPISSLASSAQQIASSRAPGTSKKPYYANFAVTVEPRIKIFEVPIMQKTVTVLDHPPNKLNIFPDYTSGKANTLQFELHYETFHPRQFPKTLTERDSALKQEYMFSNELLQDSNVLKESVSRQATIEVYRLDRKPTSLREFDENYIGSVDLVMDNPISTYTGAVFYDRIPSNKKYYYVFRVANENGMPGYMQEIIEAEYINDGGYRYAMFNTLYEEDLKEQLFKETVKKAKKLFQIVPSARQTVLDSDNADFNGTAKEALEAGAIQLGTAEELIWGKTFKVRLTSRKTGKKIDLNVTYKQNNEF